MASYTYKDITRALLTAGFKEQKNNGGSHQMFVHEATGFAQPVPEHSNGMVANGTAESILDYVVLVARISNINIANDKYKLSNSVVEYIKKQHAYVKKNFCNLVPAKVRTQNNLRTEDQVRAFVKEKIIAAKMWQKKHTQKELTR